MVNPGNPLPRPYVVGNDATAAIKTLAEKLAAMSPEERDAYLAQNGDEVGDLVLDEKTTLGEVEVKVTVGDLLATGGGAAAASLLPSIVRTVVPWAVGLLILWLTRIGVTVEEGTLTTLVTAVVSAAYGVGYYLLVRVLETFASSRFGWLLGWAKLPIYVKPLPVAVEGAGVRVG